MSRNSISINKKCRTDGNTWERTEHGVTNLKLLNGYWVWWCYTHSQPMIWCEKERLELTISKIKGALQ